MVLLRHFFFWLEAKGVGGWGIAPWDNYDSEHYNYMDFFNAQNIVWEYAKKSFAFFVKK